MNDAWAFRGHIHLHCMLYERGPNHGYSVDFFFGKSSFLLVVVCYPLRVLLNDDTSID